MVLEFGSCKKNKRRRLTYCVGCRIITIVLGQIAWISNFFGSVFVYLPNHHYSMLGRRHIVAILIGSVVIAGYLRFLKNQNHLVSYKGIKSYQVYAQSKPKVLNFCDEPVPLHISGVQEKLDREVYIYSHYINSTKKLVKRANYWFPIIEKILEENGLPEDLKYLAVIESNLSNVQSDAGAVGFWQLLSNTGQNFGLEINHQIDQRRDPEKATFAACQYFLTSYESLHNWTNAAASYNMGITGVRRRIKAQHKDLYYELKLNKETARYVYKAIAFKEIYLNREKYDLPLVVESSRLMQTFSYVVVQESILDLNQFAKKYNMNASQVRKFNPWILGNRLDIEAGKQYYLKIPSSNYETKEFENNKVMYDLIEAPVS